MSRYFGEIPGIPEGTLFINRKDASSKKVHRPTVAGISGGATEGADSIVLSGGYVDDKDYGDEIIYTGHGGNDPSTKKQIANQTFTLGNLALVVSENEHLPVRVIRGSKHRSSYSPSSGYRYDGLYYVVEHWMEKGIDGFDICRFRLIKESNELIVTENVEESQEHQQTQRVERKSSRIVRNSQLALDVKEIYDHSCQVCGIQLPVLGGFYSEAAHIKGLGEPHNGPDVLENLLCLCPNHHVLFDKGAFSINEDFSIVGLSDYSKLVVKNDKHSIGKEFLSYHKNHCYIKTSEHK